MSYSAQAHRNPGDEITAAWLNQLLDNIALLKTSIAADGSLISGLTIAIPTIVNYEEPFTAPTIISVAKTISANTLANPTVITTSAAHGWATGDYVTITGSNSTPTIDGVRQITVTDSTHFSVAVNVTVAGTAGTATLTTLTLDLSTGCEFAVSLNANITKLTITNIPTSSNITTLTIRFTADGTQRTIIWPTSFRWGSAVAPVMTLTSTKVDIITARTYDGGTSWFPTAYTQNA